MKKSTCRWILFSILFIVFVVCIFPFILGNITKQKYMQRLALVSSNTNFVKITVVNYHRGWFSSEATLKVSIISRQSLPPTDLMIKQTIQHGPIFSIEGIDHKKTLLIGQALIESHVNSPLGQADIAVWVKPNGLLVGLLTSPELVYTLFLSNPSPLGQTASRSLKMTGFSGIFKVSADMKRIVANGHMAQLDVHDSQTQEKINQVDVSCDLQKSESGLFVGTQNYKIGSLQWQADSYPSTLTLNGFEVKTYDEEKNNKMDSFFEIKLKKIMVDQTGYGPQQLDLAIKQLDISTLLLAKEQLRVLQQRKEMVSFPEWIAAYRDIFLPLLGKGVTIQIKHLSLVTPWGSPRLQAEISLLPQQNPDLLSVANNAMITAQLMLPAVFLTHIVERIEDLNNSPLSIDSDPALIQRKITAWVDKKWILPKKEGYEMNVMYANKHMRINGEPFEESDAISHMLQ